MGFLEALQIQFHAFGEQLELINEKIDKMEERLARVEQSFETHTRQNHQDEQQLMQIMRSWTRKSRLKLSEP
jgi:predicted  nucleic acid-binding Zn-ribbon protein